MKNSTNTARYLFSAKMIQEKHWPLPRTSSAAIMTVTRNMPKWLNK